MLHKLQQSVVTLVGDSMPAATAQGKDVHLAPLKHNSSTIKTKNNNAKKNTHSVPYSQEHSFSPTSLNHL